MDAQQPLVAIRDLKVRFVGAGAPVHAVNGVDLQVARGEVVALIGESGSGKSVTLRTVMALHNPARTRVEGSVKVVDREVLTMTRSQLADLRGATVSMIFQEPLLAFDPVYTVGDQIIESIIRHERITRDAARARALALFERVRIPSPERRLQAYPHEMSGGMRQRAMIALALACNPQVLLADEPTTALDATVQIQILLLLRELQRDLGLSILFVTHDIGAAVEIADRIAVMYAGRIVESGPVREVLRSPRHPYTIALLRSRAHGELKIGERLPAIPGSPPDCSALPPGCAFAERCAYAQQACLDEQPPVSAVGEQHSVRCLRVEAVRAGVEG